MLCARLYDISIIDIIGSMIYLPQTPSHLKTFNNTPSGHVQLSPQGSVMIAICDIFLCLKKNANCPLQVID